MTWDIEPIEFGDVMKEDLGRLRTQVSLDLLRTMVIRSPVDTGRFRGSWNVSYNSPVDISQIGSAGSSISRGAANLAPRATRAFETVWINNGLPYAGKLETGTSKQAPKGIMRISIASIRLKYQL